MSGRSIPRIAVIGGGITGLSAAFYLRKGLDEKGLDAELTLIESGSRLGGRIETLRKDGFTIEKGPDSFLGRKLPILELTRDLGLLDELVTTNPQASKTYIFQGGRLHPMPPKLVLGIPTDMAAFLKTELLSIDAKFRASQDLLLPPRDDDGSDESLGGFLARRLGPEVVDRISEPLLAGIYAGDLYRLSLMSTFPAFRGAELEHGSLIRGTRRGAKGVPPQTVPDYIPAAARGGVFMTYRGGLRTLVDGLDDALSGVKRRMNTGVSAITPASRAGESGYILELDGGERLAADAVIVTAPGGAAASMLEPLTDASMLRAVQYVSVANVVMAYPRAAVQAMEFDGSGFLVPRSEGRTITACTWTSSKWLHSSPDDHVLLRCYVGRAGAEGAVELPDSELLEAVRRDVRDTMGIDAEPLFTEITRLRHSMPQYPVGHQEAITELRERMNIEAPGVYVTGAAFNGVGLPDCIRQGREAAEHISAASLVRWIGCSGVTFEKIGSFLFAIEGTIGIIAEGFRCYYTCSFTARGAVFLSFSRSNSRQQQAEAAQTPHEAVFHLQHHSDRRSRLAARRLFSYARLGGTYRLADSRGRSRCRAPSRPGDSVPGDSVPGDSVRRRLRLWSNWRGSGDPRIPPSSIFVSSSFLKRYAVLIPVSL